jgi:hypothetical protein
MNIRIWGKPRLLLRVGALAAILACGGCLEHRVVWSPDGTRAAVIGDRGLYLADGEGHISELLVPDVYLAAWLGDSRRLVLARERTLGKWSEIAPFIGPDRAKIEAQAQDISQAASTDPLAHQIEQTKGNKRLLEICLRDVHGDIVRAKMSDHDWKDLENETADVSELILAHVEGEKIAVDRVRFTGFGTIQDIRTSPHGDAVEFTQDRVMESAAGRLLVLLTTDDAAPQSIAKNPAAYPDWTPDGRSIVYVEGGAKASEDDVVLGVLTRRQVIDAQGKITISDHPEYLAGVMFSATTHVRCLRDGRIVFNAVEMSLPMATQDYSDDLREQLFALDPARQSTLVRLLPRKHESDAPQGLAFFEVSPDESQILIGGVDGKVCVLTIATGDFESLQEDAKPRFKGLPSWRSAGEFSYTKRIEANDGKEPDRPAEIVLHRQGKQEVVLSKGWPDAVLHDVAKNDSR